MRLSGSQGVDHILNAAKKADRLAFGCDGVGAEIHQRILLIEGVLRQWQMKAPDGGPEFRAESELQSVEGAAPFSASRFTQTPSLSSRMCGT